MECTYTTSGRTSMLKRRTERCVCRHCGGKLRLKRIIFSEFEDARVESYCDICERIEFGVESEIYQCAKYFVDVMQFNCFPNQDANRITEKMNIAKVCDILSWGCKNLHLLNENGFSVPVEVDEAMLNECVIWSNEDIARLSRKEEGNE